MKTNDLGYKFYLLKKLLREKGFIFIVRKGFFSLSKPFNMLVKKNTRLINLFYGVLPAFSTQIFRGKYQTLKYDEDGLVAEARQFWYVNDAGEFDLDGEKISRKDFFTYGGPDPKFTCSVCQKSEWLSRVRQKNLFIKHSCAQAGECEILCSRQGDELWTNLHQNFDFSMISDSRTPAPRCLCVMPEDKNSSIGGLYHRFSQPGCDQWMLLLKRRLAYSCQTQVVSYPGNINWDDYDFVLVQNTGFNRKFPRPPKTVIMYGHDFWPLDDKG
jgi:hypothetical protein